MSGAINVDKVTKVYGPRGNHTFALDRISLEGIGELLVDTIGSDRTLVLTHPEVRDILLQRAADFDGFMDHQLADLTAVDGGQA